MKRGDLDPYWPLKRWFTQDEAAAYLGMAKETFWRRCRKLFVPAGITNRPLYDRNDLDRYLESRKAKVDLPERSNQWKRKN